jgi:hypothetical protein
VDQLPSMLSVIVNLGFAALVGWYLLTRALPRLQDEFRSDLKAKREEFSIATREARADFKEALLESRAGFRDALASVLNHCEREQAQRDVTFAKELELLHQVLASREDK